MNNEILQGKVIKFMENNYKAVINKGEADGVRKGHIFLLYFLGDELFDPDTNESLGRLEILCGEAKVSHIQDRITTVESNSYVDTTTTTKIIRNNKTLSFFGDQTEEIQEPQKEQKPFEYTNNKDILFKRIK